MTLNEPFILNGIGFYQAWIGSMSYKWKNRDVELFVIKNT